MTCFCPLFWTDDKEYICPPRKLIPGENYAVKSYFVFDLVRYE